MLSDLSPEIRARLSRTANMLKTLQPVQPERMMQCAVRQLHIFRHELSDHFQHVHISGVSTGRSASEANALRRWQIGEMDLEDCSKFVAALSRLNRILVGRRSAVRSGPIGTDADRNGVSIRFPPTASSKPQLDWLRAGISGQMGKASQLLCAIASLPIVTNSHLFRDGNGRVSRILFNHILQRIGLQPDVYLPIYEIMAASQGGFLIRLRQAEIQSKWEPFISFMLDFIDLCASTENNRGSRTENDGSGRL
jgi:hypothetical protein